ncbi:MAG: tetratricopeptide repeat protein [Rudaea sp.]|uniref:tetratricopeptide repeat protein n=1 Tax=Rudaea sp. TaxID=2136325 RepID=UPI0039E5CACA
MPILVLLSLALQIACAVHVVRTRRELYWIWIILIGSYLGVAIYVMANVLPDLRHDPRARKTATKMLDTVAPERRRKQIEQRLELADTVDNRRALAEECLNLGDYANAAELYRSVLTGMNANDAGFLLGLARALAGLDDFAGARDTLDKLSATNPQLRSNDADLLRTRIDEALGDPAAALARYRDLATSYPGEEARYCYGALLVQRSRFREAREVFNDMLKRAKVSPSYYRRKEAHWLDAAKRDLAGLGPG